MYQEMKHLLRIDLDRRLGVAGIQTRIASVFGFQSKTVTRTWNELVNGNLLPKNSTVRHMLYFLAYMKSYCNYSVYMTMFSISKQTMNTWVWKFAKAIASMYHIVSTPHMYFTYVLVLVLTNMCLIVDCMGFSFAT